MISVEDSLAIGDGANDLEMLTAAGLGIAFNGKPLLRKIIHTQLNHTDLSGLLFLQGYSASQIFS
jgi:phosphoserine phosphatase